MFSDYQIQELGGDYLQFVLQTEMGVVYMRVPVCNMVAALAKCVCMCLGE